MTNDDEGRAHAIVYNRIRRNRERDFSVQYPKKKGFILRSGNDAAHNGAVALNKQKQLKRIRINGHQWPRTFRIYCNWLAFIARLFSFVQMELAVWN